MGTVHNRLGRRHTVVHVKQRRPVVRTVATTRMVAWIAALRAGQRVSVTAARPGGTLVGTDDPELEERVLTPENQKRCERLVECARVILVHELKGLVAVAAVDAVQPRHVFAAASFAEFLARPSDAHLLVLRKEGQVLAFETTTASI